MPTARSAQLFFQKYKFIMNKDNTPSTGALVINHPILQPCREDARVELPEAAILHRK